MAITVNIYYTGKDGNALRFADEMERSGIADEIRKEDGNLRYQYFVPLGDTDTVLLIDAWQDQESLDRHHSSPMMKKISEMREKYDLHMKAEKFIPEENMDTSFIRS